MAASDAGFPVGNQDMFQRGLYKWVEKITQKPFIAQEIPKKVRLKIDRRRRDLRRGLR